MRVFPNNPSQTRVLAPSSQAVFCLVFSSGIYPFLGCVSTDDKLPRENHSLYKRRKTWYLWSTGSLTVWWFCLEETSRKGFPTDRSHGWGFNKYKHMPALDPWPLDTAQSEEVLLGIEVVILGFFQGYRWHIVVKTGPWGGMTHVCYLT